MIETLTVQMDFTSLPEKTQEALRKRALKRGVGVGVVVKEMIVEISDRVLSSDDEGTSVVGALATAGA